MAAGSPLAGVPLPPAAAAAAAAANLVHGGGVLATLLWEL
jgi:hypothetical protein